MTSYNDDNFGEYDIHDDEDVEFYFRIQDTNVEKKCKGCGRTVKIQPQYAYCNSCANKIERGEDVGYYDDEDGECPECGTEHPATEDCPDFEEDVNDEPPPDFGPPGTGAVITEW